MPQTLLPMFPAEVTAINEVVAFAKREGTVYYFQGMLPVFSHAEADRASFRMYASQLVCHGHCTQAELVRAFGISTISMKRYVKQYRQEGIAGFFKPPAARRPRVLTAAVCQQAQALLQAGQERQAVAQALGLKGDTLRKAIKAGRLVEPIKKK